VGRERQAFKLVQAPAAAEGDAAVADSARRGLALVLTEIGTRVKLCGDTAQCMAMYREALDADPTYAVRAYIPSHDGLLVLRRVLVKSVSTCTAAAAHAADTACAMRH
jgi:hypothetical protein